MKGMYDDKLLKESILTNFNGVVKVYAKRVLCGIEANSYIRKKAIQLLELKYE